ncbi:MAG: hypothetical protein IIZ42_04500 [Eubacterium sp.]|nr:hypothetical protein [Eubacterium sp.]
MFTVPARAGRKEQAMKRRTIALVLIMLMISGCVLTGCGKKSGSSGESIAEHASGQPSEETAEETEEEGSGETTDVQKKDPKEEWSEKDFSELRGRVEDGVYTNDYFGITFDASKSNWLIGDEAELAEYAGLPDGSGEEEFKAYFEDNGHFFDVFFENLQDYSNINVVIQDLGLLGGAMTDLDDYVEAALDAAAESLENEGLTDVKSEAGTTYFMGEKEVPCVYVTGTLQGIDIFQRQIYVKRGRYIACITATCFNSDMTKERLAGFKAL